MIRTHALLLLSIFCATACGANSAAIPQGLLDAINAAEGDASAGGAAYPAGPYGARKGDVTPELCFEGWTDPAADGYDQGRLDRICLSDFHADPEARLLLVESCAVWCAACRTEYGGDGAARSSLEARLDERRGRGFRVLGTIFQDAASNPATAADAAKWAKVYSLRFPFVVDDDHQLGLFTSSVIAPFNLLIDARTMKIVLEVSGDEPAVLFGAVDRFLDAASSSP